jgi:hypothetical protein
MKHRKLLGKAKWGRRRLPLFWVGLGLASILIPPPLSAQEAGHEHEEHAHHLGLMIGPVYSVHEKTLNPGIGIEYERVLPIGDRILGLGVGVETILAEHGHYVASFLFHIHPVREITLTAGPGLAFIKHEGDTWERRLAFHFSGGYEFELGMMFIAPAFELGVAGEDVHLMLGAHIGFGF